MGRRKILLVGAGQIGGNLALLAAQKRSSAMWCCKTWSKACPKARPPPPLDPPAALRAVDGYDAKITGTNTYEGRRGS